MRAESLELAEDCSKIIKPISDPGQTEAWELLGTYKCKPFVVVRVDESLLVVGIRWSVRHAETV